MMDDMNATEVYLRHIEKIIGDSWDVFTELEIDFIIYGSNRFFIADDGKITRIPPEDWEKK